MARTAQTIASRWQWVAAISIGLLALIALASPAAEAKKMGGGNLDVSQAVGAQIPDAIPRAAPQPNLEGVLLSTIDAGKRFKGKRIRDVNVTVQTTGGVADAGQDLVLYLTAPNGTTVRLFGFLTATSIGPLTLDDETPVTVATGSPPNPSNSFELPPPFAGAAQPSTSLVVMDNGPVRGTWTLRATDVRNPPARQSVLTSWRLQVIAGRPYRSK